MALKLEERYRLDRHSAGIDMTSRKSLSQLQQAETFIYDSTQRQARPQTMVLDDRGEKKVSHKVDRWIKSRYRSKQDEGQCNIIWINGLKAGWYLSVHAVVVTWCCEEALLHPQCSSIIAAPQLVVFGVELYCLPPWEEGFPFGLLHTNSYLRTDQKLTRLYLTQLQKLPILLNMYGILPPYSSLLSAEIIPYPTY
uniref:Uncharacterized protein LOC108047787 n=1 Tax=Drosophila rhopaloa TaxID=1041015 RepID=A0A6P4F3N6_DRORH